MKKNLLVFLFLVSQSVFAGTYLPWIYCSYHLEGEQQNLEVLVDSEKLCSFTHGVKDEAIFISTVGATGLDSQMSVFKGSLEIIENSINGTFNLSRDERVDIKGENIGNIKMLINEVVEARMSCGFLQFQIDC